MTLPDWSHEGGGFEEWQARQEQLREAWLSLLRSPEGRLVLEDLRRTCRPEHSVLITRADGGADVERTMVRIGHHEVWLQVLARMGLTYDQVVEKLADGRSQPDG